MYDILIESLALVWYLDRSIVLELMVLFLLFVI